MKKSVSEKDYFQKKLLVNYKTKPILKNANLSSLHNKRRLSYDQTPNKMFLPKYFNLMASQLNLNKEHSKDSYSLYANYNINNQSKDITASHELPIINDNNQLPKEREKVIMSQKRRITNKKNKETHFRKSNLLPSNDEFGKNIFRERDNLESKNKFSISPQKKKRYVLNANNTAIKPEDLISSNLNNMNINDIDIDNEFNELGLKGNYKCNMKINTNHLTEKKMFHSPTKSNKTFSLYNLSYSNVNITSSSNGSVSKQLHKVKSFAVSKEGTNEKLEPKTNQDSYVRLENIMNLDYSIYGVMDGHGTNGHLVSQYIKKRIEEYFSSPSNYENTQHSAVLSISAPINNSSNIKFNEVKIYEILSRSNYSFIRKFINKLSDEIFAQKNFEVEYSGSTCILIIKISQNLIIVNIGDSRGILISENKMAHPSLTKFSLYPEQLNTEHKPGLRAEKDRIVKCGGEVKIFEEDAQYDDSPLRVWVKGENYPGIAMSRSIGDRVAEGIGVNHVADIKTKCLNNSSKCFVVASDGVWDVLSNDYVNAIVGEYFVGNDVEGACKAVVRKARELWEKSDLNVDDITVVMGFL